MPGWPFCPPGLRPLDSRSGAFLTAVRVGYLAEVMVLVGQARFQLLDPFRQLGDLGGQPKHLDFKGLMTVGCGLLLKH